MADLGGDSKRWEILKAATRVFQRKGYRDTTMKDLAEESGVSMDELKVYFPTKAHIFTEVSEYLINQIGESALRKTRSVPSDDPRDVLKNWIRGYLEAVYFLYDEYLKIMMDFWNVGTVPEDPDSLEHKRLKDMYSKAIEFFKEVIKEGIEKGVFREVDPELAASTLMAMLDGTVLQWLIFDKGFNLALSAETMLEIFMEGLEICDEKGKKA